MTTRVTITDTTVETRLTISPLGVQGIQGEPGFTVDERAALAAANDPSGTNPIATMADILPIIVVDVLPDQQVTGTLYFVKP